MYNYKYIIGRAASTFVYPKILSQQKIGSHEESASWIDGKLIWNLRGGISLWTGDISDIGNSLTHPLKIP